MKIDTTPPIEKAARYSSLIRKGKWDEIDANEFRALLRRLSDDAKDNLDEPSELPLKLSGEQAKSALTVIFHALKAPRRGSRKSREKWEAERWKPIERTLVAAQGVQGATTDSFDEFNAWLAMRLLSARAEARRRGVSTFDVFRKEIRLTERWGHESATDRHKVITFFYKNAVATLGFAGKPTQRAIRRSLGLDSRSRRSGRRLISADLLEIEKDGTVRIYDDRAFRKGLHILGEKTRN